MSLFYVVDIWSWVHLSFFLWLVFRDPGRVTLRNVVVMSLLIGYGWEVFESASGFLQGPDGGEPWYNRWVSDPAMDLFGALWGYLLRRKAS